MSLVSLDAIVQADATLIVGILFLLTLKRALRQKVTRDDLKFVASAIVLYVLSGIAAVFPDAVSSLGLVLGNPGTVAYMDWLVRMCSFGSILLFYLGMAVTAGAVYWMMRRTEAIHTTKPAAKTTDNHPDQAVPPTPPAVVQYKTRLERFDEVFRTLLVIAAVLTSFYLASSPFVVSFFKLTLFLAVTIVIWAVAVLWGGHPYANVARALSLQALSFDLLFLAWVLCVAYGLAMINPPSLAVALSVDVPAVISAGIGFLGGRYLGLTIRRTLVALLLLGIMMTGLGLIL